MTARPDRKATLPLLNPAARLPEELAENFRRVYAGALADHRSLEGGGGVYAVRVLPPLKVTDEGLALDLGDPQLIQYVSGLVEAAPGGGGDDKLVAVDVGDDADYLQSQIVTYHEPETQDKLGVNILKPGPHEPLEGWVSLDDLRGKLGTPWIHEATFEVKVHFIGTDATEIDINNTDYRGALLHFWERGAASIQALTLNRHYSDGAGDPGIWTATRARALPTGGIGTPHYGLADGGSALFVEAGLDDQTPPMPQHSVLFLLCLDKADGHPKLAITPCINGLVNFAGDWSPGAYQMNDVVAHDMAYWRSTADNNTDEPGPLAETWERFFMPEAYYHALVRVIGVVPDDVDDYQDVGNAVGS
jgi:hypothetical protein